MKHIFVVNTYAGSASAKAQMERLLADFDAEYEIYYTKGHKDATEYVKQRCSQGGGETLRFYACGGDGTIKEVVDGVYGYDNAEISVVPLGSGNDFVKYYGGADSFLDLNKLKDAESAYIDLIRVNGEYCINVCNFGFDSYAANVMSEVRHKKIIGGKNAYTFGVLKAFLFGMKSNAEIYADGEKLIDGGFTLCTAANGQYIGGAYRCAPLSRNDDGILDICAVKPMSRLSVLRLIGSYKDGTHLDDPRFAKYIVYRRAKKLEVKGHQDIVVALDGELVQMRDFVCEVVPHAVKFAAVALSGKKTEDGH